MKELKDVLKKIVNDLEESAIAVQVLSSSTEQRVFQLSSPADRCTSRKSEMIWSTDRGSRFRSSAIGGKQQQGMMEPQELDFGWHGAAWLSAQRW